MHKQSTDLWIQGWFSTVKMTKALVTVICLFLCAAVQLGHKTQGEKRWSRLAAEETIAALLQQIQKQSETIDNLVKTIESTNQAHKAELAEAKAENAALKAELAEVNSKLSWLLEQTTSNNRKIYGSSSEKSAYDFGGAQVGLFEEAVPVVPIIETVESADNAPPRQSPKKRGEMGSRLPTNLTVEKVECMLPEDEQDCPKGHGPMRAIGKELVRRELKMIPAKAIVTEFWRYSYLCRVCEGTTVGPAPIVKAELPPQVIKGSMCAPETVAHIAVEKCTMGSPLYRQEAAWNRIGIQINRQTMASWLIKCSEDYLEPIYDRLHWQLCQQKFLHSDSTNFQVLKEPGRPAQSQSQMWLYRTSGDAEHPIVLYDYQEDKKQERPRDFLAGFSGYLMTDGFSSYHCLPDDIIVVGCFAHVFRRFSDALKVIKKDEDRVGSLALMGKQFCGKLFDIERDIKDKSFDERHTIRNEKAPPILDEFRTWLLSVQPFVATQSKIGKAVNYTLNQWKYLERYLLDGRIECNNSRAERSIKPFVINRKNFLFADSVAGARAAAVLHSMTETAKENSLDPHSYLSHVFRTAAGVNLWENHDMVIALLPENAPAECQVPQ